MTSAVRKPVELTTVGERVRFLVGRLSKGDVGFADRHSADMPNSRIIGSSEIVSIGLIPVLRCIAHAVIAFFVAALLVAVDWRKTVITIAHRLSTLRDCGALFVPGGGRCAARGAHAALLARNDAFRQMAKGAA
jgi:hypothetical protein